MDRYTRNLITFPGALGEGATPKHDPRETTPNATLGWRDNGRIEVDGREPAQMRSARGFGICQMGPAFSSLAGAQDFARRNFQSGTCSCR